ncbi:hypothetical protein MTHERMOG20_25160 [Moorella thermoacetica]|uniref:Uncharacterized protein n=1 Tax=Neomoorella thermoacetica TaxID=1525 RepID=A0AAC9MVY5_NEOTH|nr:hypothetical protein [Moorella thermoacetica]AKX95045.1 hypothetical protein MOTHE_c22620 [Moorella thermoacetica]AKX97671.1 hypothetical protein MOTHA_c23350 [Moorella thermoacetica]AOQ25186.1 hypothetical protein Maut_02770 [Moorella thermoacetica]OIQ53918.1 hypothetical protein MOCA_23830 [Moorella thermoacetica]QDA01493.1 hypothetical protein MothHH_02379 [Moorella thermoacetica]
MPGRKKARGEEKSKDNPAAWQNIESEEDLALEFMDALLDRCCREDGKPV